MQQDKIDMPEFDPLTSSLFGPADPNDFLTATQIQPLFTSFHNTRQNNMGTQQSFLKFPVGQRIKFITDAGGISEDAKGTVIFADRDPRDGENTLVIEMDDCHVSENRDGRPLIQGKAGHCITLACGSQRNDIDRYIVPIKIKKTKANIDYQPGTPISAYVDAIIQKETDKVRLKWLKTFQNCVLPPHVKETIEEALTVILCQHKFEEWGINEHFEKGLTNSILLFGPPGVGKSMISESLAAVLGKNLMKIDSGTLQSNVPGQTERNIKKAFEDAKKNDCVLMFDECDSVLSNRDMVGVILAAEINTLLTEIENFDGVCVLTTNRLHNLDPALARRIVAKVRLDLPDKETRAQIWKKLMPPEMPLCESVDFNLLALHALSGGEIKNAIILAARKAIAKNLDKVTQKHFDDALALVVSGKTEFENSEARGYRRTSWSRQSGAGISKEKDVEVGRTNGTGNGSLYKDVSKIFFTNGATQNADDKA